MSDRHPKKEIATVSYHRGGDRPLHREVTTATDSDEIVRLVGEGWNVIACQLTRDIRSGK